MTSTVIPSAPPVDRQWSGSPARAGRTERRVFGWCCAAVAVHILIDAYLDLRPGTSPADHPISGTAPVLGLTTLWYVLQRVRAGVAAMIAIQLGLAVMIAGAAPLDMLIRAGRIAPGPVSGAIGVAAGAVLVGLGAVMLWRNRRAGGRRLRRWGRRTGIAVAGFALFIALASPIGHAFAQTNWHTGYQLDEIPLGPDYERVDLETSDGLTIVAAYRPSTNGAAVIQFAGRRADHEEMLARHGYGVFVLEPRGRHDHDLRTLTFSPSSVLTAATAVFSDSLPPPPIPELIDDIAPRPILLIWAGGGGGGEYIAEHYFERAGEPKSIWNIPEAEHTGGLEARPAEYERRVIGFFDDALLR